jgi:hypothetical protein
MEEVAEEVEEVAVGLFFANPCFFLNINLRFMLGFSIFIFTKNIEMRDY